MENVLSDGFAYSFGCRLFYMLIPACSCCRQVALRASGAVLPQIDLQRRGIFTLSCLIELPEESQKDQ